MIILNLYFLSDINFYVNYRNVYDRIVCILFTKLIQLALQKIPISIPLFLGHGVLQYFEQQNILGLQL